MNSLARQFANMFGMRGGSGSTTRSRASDDVVAGARFRRVVSGRVVELAEVISVRRDAFGIPHVRFNLHFQRPYQRAVVDGPRVLALESFATQYPERVETTPGA
jgi:hypothetical protein